MATNPRGRCRHSSVAWHLLIGNLDMKDVCERKPDNSTPAFYPPEVATVVDRSALNHTRLNSRPAIAS